MKRLPVDGVLDRLRTLLADGTPQRRAAQALTLHPSHVNRLIKRHALPARTWLTKEERRTIQRLMRRGLTPREIADQVARSRRTIELLRKLWEDRPVEKGAIVFRKAAQICPQHGRVTVWPCVACTASKHLRSPAQAD